MKDDNSYEKDLKLPKILIISNQDSMESLEPIQNPNKKDRFPNFENFNKNKQIISLQKKVTK